MYGTCMFGMGPLRRAAGKTMDPHRKSPRPVTFDRARTFPVCEICLAWTVSADHFTRGAGCCDQRRVKQAAGASGLFIFHFCCHAAPNMALSLIDLQHLLDLPVKLGVNVF